MYDLKFADVGEGVHEGEIVEWHVKVGEMVKVEQLLVEVHTEKVNVDITAPVSGKIKKLGAGPGETIIVGDSLVLIDQNGGVESSKSSTDTKSQRMSSSGDSQLTGFGKIKGQDSTEKDDSLFVPTSSLKVSQIPREKAQKRNEQEVILAAPAVRRMAREKGIDLSLVQGTASNGRITMQDFEHALKNINSSPAPAKTSDLQTRSIPEYRTPAMLQEEEIPLRGIRKTMARSMRKSKGTTAHFTYFDEVDLTALDKLRAESKSLGEMYGIKLTYLPIIAKCVTKALEMYPLINSRLNDEENMIQKYGVVNLGVAVDTEEGLIVPVVKQADQKSIWQIASEIRELAGKAKENKLTLPEISEGTITITSIGNIGGMMATPVIKWPEVAIIGLMKGKLRPVVITDSKGEHSIEIRKIMYLSVSIDHRIIDGAYAARFVNALINYIQNPGLLALS